MFVIIINFNDNIMQQQAKEVLNYKLVCAYLFYFIILFGYIGSMIYLVIYVAGYKNDNLSLTYCDFSKNDCNYKNQDSCKCGNLTYQAYDQNKDTFDKIKPDIQTNGCYKSYDDFCLIYMINLNEYFDNHVKTNLIVTIIFGLLLGSCIVGTVFAIIIGDSCIMQNEKLYKLVYIEVPQKFMYNNFFSLCEYCQKKTNKVYICPGKCDVICCPDCYGSQTKCPKCNTKN